MTASPRTRRAVGKAGDKAGADFLLTPAGQAAMLGLNAIQTNLRIWRMVSDSMRDSVRQQQDAMLKLVLENSTEAPTKEVADAAETVVENTANGATDFFMPVFAARRAYVQMSGAMIEAQREALAALMRGNARPH